MNFERPKRGDGFYITKYGQVLSGLSVQQTARLLKVYPTAIYNRTIAKSVNFFIVNETTWILDSSVVMLYLEKFRNKKAYCYEISTNNSTYKVYSDLMLGQICRFWHNVKVVCKEVQREELRERFESLKHFEYYYLISKNQYIAAIRNIGSNQYDVMLAEEKKSILLWKMEVEKFQTKRLNFLKRLKLKKLTFFLKRKSQEDYFKNLEKP